MIQIPQVKYLVSAHFQIFEAAIMDQEVCNHCGKKKQADKDATGKICQCCDKLRTALLVPTATTTSNLDALLNELCGQITAGNTPQQKNFVQTKEDFLNENFPHLTEGRNVHPGVFIGRQREHGFPEPDKETSEDLGNICEGEVYSFLMREFQNEDCMIFHSYKSGIDTKVVEQLFNKLHESLDLKTHTVQEVEDRMKTLADLALLDFSSIEDEAIKKTPTGASAIDGCKQKISILKTHLNRQSQEKDFIVVSLSLTAILHFEVKSNPNANASAKTQIFRMKKFMERLQVPEMTGEWSFLPFVVIPRVSVKVADPRGTKYQNCPKCRKHVLYKDDLEAGGFVAKAQMIILEESAAAGSSLLVSEAHPSQFKRKSRLIEARLREEEEKEIFKVAETFRKKRNYIDLISNMVVLSSMDLLPHHCAVGKVMTQLTGVDKGVAGPGEAPHDGLCTYAGIMLWNPDQKHVQDNPPKKAVITSDYGCGKSTMLHAMIVEWARQGDRRLNWLLSFLDAASEPPHVRGVLDICNKMMYRNMGIEVMAIKDLKKRNIHENDPFAILYQLTKTYPYSNFAVDEVPLELLVKQKRIHHKYFHGSIWLAVSSTAKYDFKNKDEKTDLGEILIEKSQGFKIIHLTKNMRNGSKILADSFKLQEGTIEKGTKEWRAEATDRSQQASASADQSTEKSSKPSTDLSAPVTSKTTDINKADVASALQSETIEARLVEGGKDAVFEGPQQEATGCLTIPGMKPRCLRGEEAARFMADTIRQRCSEKTECIVVLGNEDADIDWILKCLMDTENPQADWLTVYNPKEEADITESEANLQQYLKKNSGCLVTLGKRFNGMSSAVTVLVYSNPYSCNFRANYMRASVELILLDRNKMGTAPLVWIIATFL